VDLVILFKIISLSEAQYGEANEYYNIFLIILIGSSSLLIFTIEGVYNEPVSPISGTSTTICAFLYGVMTHPYFTVIFDVKGIWRIEFINPFDIYIQIFIFVVFGFVEGRVLLYLIPKFRENRHYNAILSIFGLVIIEFSLVYAIYIKSFEFFFITIMTGCICLFSGFFSNPYSLFVNTSQIHNIFIIDMDGGTPFFSLYEKDDLNLFSGGLQGSFLIQKEISGAKRLPEEYIFGDKVFLISAQKYHERTICAILIAEKKMFGFRQSLRFMLKRFIGEFQEKLIEKNLDSAIFEPFVKEVKHIFKYALKTEK
jgi:hypothetical protein